MARLRDPHKQIPGGLRFRQPETGFDSTKALPPMPSLRTLAQAVIQHRKANPHLLKLHGWKTGLEQVELEMEEYNAQVCLQNGWTDYVQIAHGESFSPKMSPPLPLASRPLGESVAAAVVGAKTISAWIGDGGKPVPAEESERRAAICAVCPANDRGDWTRWFTTPVSNLIRKQIGVKNDLKITTSKDAELEICSICACPLKLKVHVPLDHILKNIGDDTKSKLPAHCWIIAK